MKTTNAIKAKANEESGKGLSNEQIFTTFHKLPAAFKIRYTREGVSKIMLADLKETYGLQYNDLAYCLNVTDRTLHLKKGKDKFSPIVSDKVFALVDLYSFGLSVFSEKETFLKWMLTPNRILGYAPIELLDTYAGVACVKHEIKRIAYGQF